MASLSIRLLGGLSVEYDGEERTSLFSGRLRALLTFLLLQAQIPQSRQTIAFTLWPESSDKQARTNLRKLLLLLRAALGPSAHYLVVTDMTVCWRGDEHCWLDTTAFTQTLAAANNARPEVAIERLTKAVDLYRGDLLPDCYDEWILAARESLRDRYINALEQLCGLFEGEGRYADGVTMARRLLQHDPIYERGHLLLIRLQALMNDRAGALQSYHRCATLLRRELGVDPSPALEELYLRLLDPDLPAPQTTHSAQASSIPMVGREEAWQQLLYRWQKAQQGYAHFALIVGEAGIGKSRLAEEMLIWVERQGNVAAHARAYSSDNRTLIYAPIAGLLRVPAIRGEFAQMPPYWLTEIARLLPELLLERDDVRPPLPMVDDWQRHHLFAALTQALQPKRLPRLLVIDDLQWSDSETLAWLPHLLEQAKQARLMVVGTVRSEEFDDYEALQAMCETLRRRGQFTEINLGPLDAVEIGKLARHVVGQSMVEAEAKWLVAATEGNPLFVIEMARLLHDESTASTYHGSAHLSPAHQTTELAPRLDEENVFAQMPKSVLTVIEARLARLSKAARVLAEVAATIGRSFTMPVLSVAAAMAEDELVDGLDELWRRRIIRERESDAYDFSHDRIRDVSYASISTLRRRLLHKRVAAAILKTQRGALDAVSGLLGYHYEEANERLAAITHYMRAAEVAVGQYAHAEALHYLDRVLALALPTERSLRFDALLLRDRVYEVSGTIPVWEENIRQMRQLAEIDEVAGETVGEEGPISGVAATATLTGGTAARRLAAIRRRAISAERASRAAPRLHDPTRAVAHAREAVDYALLTDDIGLQARCHLALGMRLWYIADFAGAIQQLEQSITLARQIGDADTLANALELRAQTYMFNGGSASVIEALMEESHLNYEKAGNLIGRSQILNKIGYLHFAQGTGLYQSARESLLEGVQVARQIGALNVEVTLQRNLAVLYTCMGNYAAAEESLATAQALLHTIGEQGGDPTLLNYRGFIHLSQGRLADALAAQQKALAGLTAQSHRQWRVKALTALAWIHLRLEKVDEAAMYAELSLAECREINERRQLAYTLIIRGILRTEAGNFAEARSDFAEARTILHSFEMFNRALEAEVGLAYLDLLEGDADAARKGAHAILAHLERHPVDFTEDVCQLLLSCYRILNTLDPAALPRLCKLIDLHFSTRTATLDEATLMLFWQIPAHQELRQAYPS